MNTQTVAEMLRGARKLRGYSLRELAAVSSVTHATIHRIEAGQPPSGRAMARLADALKLDDEARLRLLKAAR